MAMLTVFSTVLSGTLVYVLGQIILKFFIEPVQELKKTIGVISHSLIERGNVIGNPGLGLQGFETEQELRNLAARLRSHLYLIPRYSATAQIFRLPPPPKILAASGALIGLANGVNKPDPHRFNAQSLKIVCNSLGIYEP
jgi:hypothetical protein